MSTPSWLYCLTPVGYRKIPSQVPESFQALELTLSNPANWDLHSQDRPVLTWATSGASSARRHSLATTNGGRSDGFAEPARGASTVERGRLKHLAAGAHSRAALLGTPAYQTAPSTSTQIPSGTPSPRGAHTRRLHSALSTETSNPVGRLPYDRASISVRLSAVITIIRGPGAQILHAQMRCDRRRHDPLLSMKAPSPPFMSSYRQRAGNHPIIQPPSLDTSAERLNSSNSFLGRVVS